jgi:hypothetical protein
MLDRVLMNLHPLVSSILTAVATMIMTIYEWGSISTERLILASPYWPTKLVVCCSSCGYLVGAKIPER